MGLATDGEKSAKKMKLDRKKSKKQFDKKRKAFVRMAHGQPQNPEGSAFEKRVKRFLIDKHGWDAEINHGLGYDVIARTRRGRTVYIECKAYRLEKAHFQFNQLAASNAYQDIWMIAIETPKSPIFYDRFGRLLDIANL